MYYIRYIPYSIKMGTRGLIHKKEMWRKNVRSTGAIMVLTGYS
jgi:hypothetical protein